MKYPYKKLKTENKNYPVNLSPLFMINLNNILRPSKGIITEALIDSGADDCLINSQYAETLLEVDYKTGYHIQTRGIAGTPQDVYFHEVELEIPKISGAKFIVPFGFIKTNNIGVLLGRNGFFDKFKILFDLNNGFFDLSI